METKEETTIWTRLNKKEANEVKDYYVSLSNKEREQMPPILDEWFETVIK